MNARTKLNTSYAYGSLVFAALAGWLSGSFLIFLLTSIVLVAGAFYSGDIRFDGPPSTHGAQRSRR